jgi:alanine-synthesizing transaminase
MTRSTVCYDMRVFSSRLKWDSQINPLTDLLNEKLREGAILLDLTQSNPTRAKLDYLDDDLDNDAANGPADDILASFSDRAILDYNPDPKGSPTAREAIVKHYAERGLNIDASRVLLTASTSEAYTYLFKLLTDPGDEVLVPRPSYPLFEYLAAMESVKVKQYSLRYDGRWHIDFGALEKLAGPKTRAIVVVNPNNPTGSFLKRSEWARLEEFAAKNKLAVLSDEVFSDYGFAPDAERMESLVNAGRALTFSMSGLSKVAGLPQMKLGWIIASGPRQAEALNGLEWIADTYLSVATPVQIALPSLLAAGARVREQILRRTRSNLALLMEIFPKHSACQMLDAEGGWYATLQVPRTRSEEEWSLELLRDYNVRVQPGFFYDFESEAFLVISLLTEPTSFEEGVRRISQLLDRSI